MTSPKDTRPKLVLKLVLPFRSLTMNQINSMGRWSRYKYYKMVKDVVSKCVVSEEDPVTLTTSTQNLTS